MGPILRATLRSWWLAALLSAGCTSYHEVPLHQIESHPDRLIDQRVRVHYAAAADTIPIRGRSARDRAEKGGVAVADSVISIWPAHVEYPLLSGRTFSDARLYGATAEPAQSVQLDLTDSRKVEVQAFSPAKTLLLMGGIALIAVAIYQGMQEFSDEFARDFFEGIFGGTNGRVAPPASSTGGQQ